MKSLLRPASMVAFVCSFAVTATAHPGHGEPGPTHYIAEPQHLLTIVAFAVGVAACSWILLGQRRQKQA